MVQRLAIIHEGRTRFVDVVSATRYRTLADNVSSEVGSIAAIVAILVGAWLVWRRPQRMTWAFFLFVLSLGTPNGIYVLLSSWLPQPLFLIASALAGILGALASVGILIFAVRFPKDQPAGWWRRIDAIAPLFVLPLAAFNLYFLWAFLSGREALRFQQTVDLPAFVIFAVFTLTAFVWNYRTATAESQQRMRWVIAGGLIFVIATLMQQLLLNFPVPASLVPAVNILFAMTVFFPIAVAYAIIGERIIDVNFVISRALVYGALTAIVVALLAVIDWFFGQVLAASNVARPLEVGTAIALGFWFNSLEKRVDWLIDRVFFRTRHAAEVRLRRVAQTLPHAPTFASADHFLIAEPVAALDLSSAAVFRRNGSSSLERASDVRWDGTHVRTLESDDPLVVQLAATEAPLRMRDVLRSRADQPDGHEAPVLAVPVIVRHQVRAVALYGAHRNGADLDRDEIDALSKLAAAAAAAYDHLEAERLRAQTDDLHKRLDEAQHQVGALQHALAQGRS